MVAAISKEHGANLLQTISHISVIYRYFQDDKMSKL